MKVLQLSKYYPPTNGGLELVAQFFSRALVDLGHEVNVICLGKSTGKYEGCFGEGVLVGNEDLKFNSSPLSLDYYRWMKSEIENNRPDYVLLHLPHPFAHEAAKWLRASIRAKGTKIIGIYHSDIINQVLLRGAYNLHFSRHLNLYDYFICSSPNLKQSSAILSRLSDSRVKIVPFCIDSPFSQVRSRPPGFQGKFISIGRMVPYKGYEFLIRSFNSLPYELTLVGNGPLRKSLARLARPNIKFVGEVSEEEKYRLLRSHDALIMSSINRAEAYGMTIVEAFSVGLPVIAANVDTGVSYLVRDGVTGLKFPVACARGLTGQLERLRTEPELAERLSQDCLSFFSSKLNFEAFKDNLKGVIGNA